MLGAVLLQGMIEHLLGRMTSEWQWSDVIRHGVDWPMTTNVVGFQLLMVSFGPWPQVVGQDQLTGHLFWWHVSCRSGRWRQKLLLHWTGFAHTFATFELSFTCLWTLVVRPLRISDYGMVLFLTRCRALLVPSQGPNCRRIVFADWFNLYIYIYIDAAVLNEFNWTLHWEYVLASLNRKGLWQERFWFNRIDYDINIECKLNFAHARFLFCWELFLGVLLLAFKTWRDLDDLDSRLLILNDRHLQLLFWTLTSKPGATGVTLNALDFHGWPDGRVCSGRMTMLMVTHWSLGIHFASFCTGTFYNPVVIYSCKLCVSPRSFVHIAFFRLIFVHMQVFAKRNLHLSRQYQRVQRATKLKYVVNKLCDICPIWIWVLDEDIAHHQVTKICEPSNCRMNTWNRN